MWDEEEKPIGPNIPLSEISLEDSVKLFEYISQKRRSDLTTGWQFRDILEEKKRTWQLELILAAWKGKISTNIVLVRN